MIRFTCERISAVLERINADLAVFSVEKPILGDKENSAEKPILRDTENSAENFSSEQHWFREIELWKSWSLWKSADFSCDLTPGCKGLQGNELGLIMRILHQNYSLLAPKVKHSNFILREKKTPSVKNIYQGTSKRGIFITQYICYFHKNAELGGDYPCCVVERFRVIDLMKLSLYLITNSNI